MAPWCIHISCLERVARSGSGRESVRGLVGAMDAELSRPDWLATVQSGRKQVQSRVCTPSFTRTLTTTTTRVLTLNRNPPNLLFEKSRCVKFRPEKMGAREHLMPMTSLAIVTVMARANSGHSKCCIVGPTYSDYEHNVCDKHVKLVVSSTNTLIGILKRRLQCNLLSLRLQKDVRFT